MKRHRGSFPRNLIGCRNVLLIALMASGCTHTQLILSGIDLGKKGAPVRITQRSKVALLFRTDRMDSTKVRVGDRFECAWTKVVETDGNHLLLTSKRWKTVADIPDTYLHTREVLVTARHPKYDRPTVRIPLSAVQEISVLSKHRHLPDLGARKGGIPKWALQGASTGFVTLLTYLAQLAGDEVESEDALAVGIFGAMAGSVLNTGYRLFRPEVEHISSVYRRSGGEMWEHKDDVSLER